MSLAFNLNLLLHSGLPLFFWVRPRWSIEQMGDQTGKVGGIRAEGELMTGRRGHGWEFGHRLCDM
jgi:hypothetical protein